MTRRGAALRPLLVAVAISSVALAAGWLTFELTNDAKESPRVGIVQAVAAVVGIVVAIALGLVAWWQGRGARPSAVMGDARGAAADGSLAVAESVLVDQLPTFETPGIATKSLRVHQATPLDCVPDDLDPELPTWVERSLAKDLSDWFERARGDGGFLVIFGDSSVGKTRLLYETARASIPDWRVLVPPLGDGSSVRQLADEADHLPGPVVVWLDEIYRFLPGPGLPGGGPPVTEAHVRCLLHNANQPVIVLGSLWPEHLEGGINSLRATVKHPDGTFEDRYPEASAAIGLATLMSLESMKDAEVDDARRLAPFDPRLAVAVADSDFGITQVLAGARRLVERFHAASNREQALVIAAVDARRIGVPPPLRTDLLVNLSRAYLDDVLPTDEWAASALENLRRRHGPHDRATAPLIAATSADHREVVGYEVADYLQQYVAQRRRWHKLPDAAWRTLADRINDPGTLTTIADAARRRGIDEVALDSYAKSLADAPLRRTVWRICDLLAERGDVARLGSLVYTGSTEAAYWLAMALDRQGQFTELQARAAAGDAWASHRVVLLASIRGDVDALETMADAGDKYANIGLLELLEQQRDVGRMRRRADGGDPWAARRFAELLVLTDNQAELKARAEGGDVWAAEEVAGSDLMVGLRVAATTLFVAVLPNRWRIPEPDDDVAKEVAEHAARSGAIGELRAMADNGNRHAASWLAEHLVSVGDEESILQLGLRARSGDDCASIRVAMLLDQTDHLDALRFWADSGDDAASLILARRLSKDNKLDELLLRADAGNAPAARELARRLKEDGDSETLLSRADAGDVNAARVVAESLREEGDERALWKRADGGDDAAAEELVSLLRERRDDDGLTKLVSGGVEGALAALRYVRAGTRST